MRTIYIFAAVMLTSWSSARGSETSIRHDADAATQVHLAAKEVQRYVYLRTGELLRVEATASGPSIELGVDSSLGAQAYRLKTQGDALHITGGSPVAVLYGAYHLAEKLGVQFQLDADVIPDEQIPFVLPVLDETHEPLFDTRGILPFHDFPQGPDWWSTDDYRRYITGLARMRMNFIGFHCYPPRNTGAEPLVWIGAEKDFDRETGKVKSSYKTYWANTGISSWGHARMKTSDFAAGVSQLFDKEEYGSPVFDGIPKRSQTAEQSNEVFDRVGAMLSHAFTHARNIGVKTCIGTEVPLRSPNPGTRGMSKKDTYRGLFGRIKAAHPLDYYWLWTPEHWSLHGANAKAFQQTVDEIKDARMALNELGDPFKLATAGWVLGPANDRAALDKVLDKSVALSSINRNVGHQSVDPSYGAITGRPTWAIPWLENDPNMVGPQPWVGRLRRDAVDARLFGCSGLMGIHWRTRAMSMNVPALAQAGWDQNWSDGRAPDQREKIGSLGGRLAETGMKGYVYNKVRWAMEGHRYVVPNGTYRVTLMFTEPAYKAPGVRVFDVSIQDETVLEDLDVFARVGFKKPLELSFDDIRITDHRLKIGYTAKKDHACIAGIQVHGTRDADGYFPARPYRRYISCAGYTVGKYEAGDLATTGGGRSRSEPATDFYRSWASARFGREAGPAIGRILAAVDGVEFPEISFWQGPGVLFPCEMPWEDEQKRFAFVGMLESLRSKVSGAGNLARYDYWLNTYRFTRTAARWSCALGHLEKLLGDWKAEPNPDAKKALARKALKTRIGMSRLWETMLEQLIPTVQTPGDLATLANLEQQTRTQHKKLTGHDAALKAALGVDVLPAEVKLHSEYRGPNRVLVTTRRSLADPHETLSIRVLLPSSCGVKNAVLNYRAMGGSADWKAEPVKHVARAVYAAELPLGTESVEYYIAVTFNDSESLTWPATAPELNQTVAIL